MAHLRRHDRPERVPELNPKVPLLVAALRPKSLTRYLPAGKIIIKLF